MKTHSTRAKTLALAAVSLLLGACGGGGGGGGGAGGTGGTGGTGGSGGGGTTASSHNAGQDCLNCHRTGGSGAAKGIFTVAGTVYRNDGSAQANATVRLYPSGSANAQATLTTDSLGNFWTTMTVASLVPAPGQTFVQGANVTVSVTGGGSRTMPGVISNGSCNACHSPGGGTGRVVANEAGGSHVTAAASAGSGDAAAVVNGPRSLAQIVVGDAHSCVLKTSGDVQCWGANDSGQLGNGSALPAALVSNVLLSGVTALNATGNTTCARVGDGTGASYYCWGAMTGGYSALPLYVNMLDADHLPQAVAPLLDGNQSASEDGLVQGVAGLEAVMFSAIVRGQTHSCGITSDDRVKCWEGGNASVDIPIS